MLRAFIAMPFAKEFYPVYQVIRDVCQNLGIVTIRIDEVWAREDIYQEIEQEILKADLVIADFTGDRMLDVPNPNVVHEAAFARIHKKYILLLAQDHKCLPFDWRTRPATIYSSTPDGLLYLRERLHLALQALIKRENLEQQDTVEPDLAESPAPSPPVSSTAPLNLPGGFEQRDEQYYSIMDQSPMVLIPAGTFTMGSESDDDQQPVHQVYLDTYLIDRYPVSNACYAMFIDAGGYDKWEYWTEEGWAWRTKQKVQRPQYWEDPVFGADAHPVVGVCWYEAAAYAAWAGKHLPTEAQWERAARGLDDGPYPWGTAAPAKSRCNFQRQYQGTTPVDRFEQGMSSTGCYDMAGNVWEWCADDYGPYQAGLSHNPVCCDSKSQSKVCRGGSWQSEAVELTVTFRYYAIPGGPSRQRAKTQGFRCARQLG